MSSCQCLDSLEAFRDVAISSWKDEINRKTNAKRGEGMNKLRTYALFKTEWGIEPYLDYVESRDKRSLLSRFRIGICPLRIETGRYETRII